MRCVMFDSELLGNLVTRASEIWRDTAFFRVRP
nr:MAG TPA: hypothetical protein [Caudoviricetes sp.]